MEFPLSSDRGVAVLDLRWFFSINTQHCHRVLPPCECRIRGDKAQ